MSNASSSVTTTRRQKLTANEHETRHETLHRALDELIADWMRHTDRRPSTSSVLDLMIWSSEQMASPTPAPEDG